MRGAELSFLLLVRSADPADRRCDTQTDRQTDSQTDRQTDRQADRQIDRQTDRHTDKHNKGALGLLVLNTLKLSSGLSPNFFSLAISSALGYFYFLCCRTFFLIISQ